MTQSVKCFLCRLEDLHLILRTHESRSQELWHAFVIPAGDAETSRSLELTDGLA